MVSPLSRRSFDSVRPDLILLDVEMPNLDGLETLRSLRSRGFSTPVIMVSAVTQRGARVTIEALAIGASDYVTKPAGQSDRETALRILAQDLLPKIQALTVSGAAAIAGVSGMHRRTEGVNHEPPPTAPSVVVIGVSTGGPAALDILLSAIPEGFRLPILIVQHMPELFTGSLADRLNQRCNLRVREAMEGAPVVPGVIYLARGNWHMEVVSAACTGPTPTAIHLHQGPLENHCRPAVDALFRSAAALFGAGTLGVVLTGMGSDGLSACRVIRAKGGVVLAQDRATSAVWGMPGAVTLAGLAQRVLPLSAIAPEILRLASQTTGENRAPRALAVRP